MGGPPFGSADHRPADVYVPPGGFRPSDTERDDAIEVLQSGAQQGRLSGDTFARRLDQALVVRSQEELTQLVADLPIPPPRPGLGQRIVDAVGAVAHFRFKLKAAWRGPTLPRLSLPIGAQATLRIGRMPECDLQLFDTSVSRYHAEFRRSDAGWFLVDLGSTNGTRINGWRINAPTAVHPGDEVAFGSVVFSLNGR
jgi:hypothetical protein